MKEKDKNKAGGFLGAVERIGNKIPHPFYLFLVLLVVVGIFSMIFRGVSVINPSTGEVAEVKGLFTGEGLTYIFKNMVANFINFAPLGLILTMTLGLGVAEETGFMGALMRRSMLSVPTGAVTFLVFLIGICGNIASDAATIIIPPLAAMIFLYVGKNPIAGIAVGYASTTAGFSANLIVAGTDALLAGITNEATAIINGPTIDITANWYFMAVSTFFLSIVGAVVTSRIIEPRLGKYELKNEIDLKSSDITDIEKKGLKNAGLATLIFILIIAIASFPQNSFFRNPETGSLLVRSTLMSSIVPLLFLMFLMQGIVYGKTVGTIKHSDDVPALMANAMKGMSGFIVLAFVIGQFVAWFNWSNLGLVLSINLSESIQEAGFVGIPLFIVYILICTFINLFIGSGSTKWSILAPIFIPMFSLLGYHPAWTQLLYRIGDSSTNIISPLYTYMPIILAYMNEYDEDSGIGTLLSLMIPYSVAFLVFWTILAIVWYLIGLPLGPGAPIML